MSQEGPSPCYGLSWSSNDVKCTGGLDPTYNDDDGSHQRPKCSYFHACGARKAARDGEQQRVFQIRTTQLQQQAQQAQQVPLQVPTAQAIIPHQPQVPVSAIAQQHYQRMLDTYRVSQQPQVQQAMPYPGMSLPIASYMPVNYYMPPYLSVPEPLNGSYASMLGRTVLRSMLKSVGHSIAAVLDTVPFAQPQVEKK